MKTECTQASVPWQGVAGLRSPAHLMIPSLLLAAALAAGLPRPVQAAEQGMHKPKQPFPAVSLAKRMRGEEAVQALASRLAEVAAWYGMDPQRFARVLREDRHAWLDRDGRLLFVDGFQPPPENADALAGDATAAAGLPAPLEQTFRLHSRPGASRVLYLDFNGQAVINTAWNGSYGLAAIDARPFDLDGDASAFSATEQERIQYIWQRVAEDFAPFDVDVTTEEPLPEAIARSTNTDPTFGTRVVITQDWTSLTSSPCNCGGIAYVGVFDETTEYYKPAWVFYNRLGSGNEKYVAEAISHEAGHNLGLSHDGYNNGTTSTAYYQGGGSGATGWAPIMGVGYYKELTQWSKGEYAYATQLQDDLQIIQAYGAPLRADDHGDSLDTASASQAQVADGTVGYSGSGVIATRSDVDVFRLETGGGSLAVSVSPSPRGPNLDLVADLLDSAGNLLARSNPADGLGASIGLSGLPAGTYFLRLDGTGKGDPATGYSDYASLGEYVFSATATAPHGSSPVAVASATPTSGSAPLTVAFSAKGSYDPDGSALSYDWDFGDGSAHAGSPDASHTYTAAGTYTALLSVTDTSGSVGTAQVTVTVAAAAPAIHVEYITLSTASKRKGTQATATVQIADAAGQAVGGVTVTGAWSGVVSGTASGVTSSTGLVKFTSPLTRSSGTFTFSVTGAALSGYVYDQSQNKETSDSITR